MPSIKRLLAPTTLIAGLLLAAPTPADAAAGRILYASHGYLIGVPARGGAPRRFARVPANTLDLAASRDGKRIALLTNTKLSYPKTGSVRAIYLFRSGYGLHLVRRFRSTAPLDIAISPDGREIAYGKNSEIWVMRTDGSDDHQVTEGHSVAWDPAFTPDGGSLVFDRDASMRPRNSPRIFRKPLAGGPEVQLTEDEARNPTVSSTGLLMYTRSGEGPVPSRVIVMRMDGGGRHTVDLFDDPFFDLGTTFSPDGRSIAFLRLWEKNGYAANYRYSLHTRSIGGGHHRKLVGGIRGSARRVPFAGHGPAGPIWVP